MHLVRKVLSSPLILLVKMYQWFISPLFPPSCRYTPSCSNYMLQALKVWGPIKGLYLGSRRIFSCHPWGGHGHDPVPERKRK
ncbi:MAG: membrane protein insertion efficiency factor YidD [Bacteroidota bacterium]